MKKVSIIIPVYNVENELQRCLDSIIPQLTDEMEVILIDDGSMDSSGTICDRNAECSAFLQVIHQSNAGLSEARNRGLQVAVGDYIVFIDSDDYIEPGSLKAISEMIAETHYDIIVMRAQVVYDNATSYPKMQYTVQPGVYSGIKYYSSIQKANKGFASNCVQFNAYSHSFIKENGLRFYPGIIHEDELWSLTCFIKAEQVLCTNLLFYNHFVREGSIMHSSNNRKRAESSIIICNELLRIIGTFDKNSVRAFYDRWVFIFLRGMICADEELRNQYCRLIKRWEVLRYAFYPRQRIKALCYAVAPSLYYRLLRKR